MCTMLVYRKGRIFAGRNLDLDSGFGEKVVVTPRRYTFLLKCGRTFRTRFAMIGMAAAAGTYPLYAEAVNEKGLTAGGLNFPGSAVYRDAFEGKDNITPFELIPWILGQATSVDEAEKLLSNTNLLDAAFAPSMPLAPLHFMIADRKRSIVAEQTEDGLKVYRDPYDVMTNNPAFPFHEAHMCSYRRLSVSNGEAEMQFGDGSLTPYAEGMGAIGLPGDLSSASRFVRAAFTLTNASEGGDEEADVAQTFHILGSVAMTDGTVVTAGGGRDITRYSCVMDLTDATYYYRTYWNSRITKIRLSEEAAAKEQLTVYELRTSPDFAEER